MMTSKFTGPLIISFSLLVGNSTGVAALAPAEITEAQPQVEHISAIESVAAKTPKQQIGVKEPKQYVFQTNSHVNTGISVNPGDKISVRASGSIRFGFFAGSGGPEGILFNPDYNYFINVLHGQLMVRVRQFGMQDLDGWVAIGQGWDFVVKAPGVLEFAVNDNQPGDNRGRFQIEVTIDPAQ